MDILSNYRISSHWANDDASLDLVAERVRRAHEQLDEQEATTERRRPQRLGFLRRVRHASAERAASAAGGTIVA